MGKNTERGKLKVKEVSQVHRQVYNVNNTDLSSQCIGLAVKIKETKVLNCFVLNGNDSFPLAYVNHTDFRKPVSYLEAK